MPLGHDRGTFQKGAAEAMGVEIHVDPFQSTSWVQSLTIT